MNPTDVKPEEKEVRKDEAEELGMDELTEVTGAGSPFDNVPRVPLKPVDPDLRDKG